jgi:hypothetical protein
MSKLKYILPVLVLALFLAVPVGAARVRSQTGTGEVIGEDGQVGEVVESTKEYIQKRVEEMKAMKEADRAAAKEASLARIKTRVEAMIANAVRRYERVLTQVEKAEGLSEVEKAAVSEKISAQIDAMNTLQGQVAEATTVEELKSIMVQVKSKFKFSLGLVRQAISGVYEDRLGNVAEKLVNVYTKLFEKVSALSDGEEKEELSALLAETQTLLTEAEANIEAGEFVVAKDNLVKAHENLQDVAEGVR